MKKQANPDKFFNKLNTVRARYSADINEEMLINEVMVKAPIKYQGIIASETMSKGAALKLSDLKDAMKTIWRMGSSAGNYMTAESSDESDDGGTELIGSAFNGECYNCEKKGHS
mgnify:FL=1